MRQVFLWSCQWRDTYSIIVVARDLIEARQLFIDWMKTERKGDLSILDIGYIRVKRTFAGEHRPIYVQ